MKDCHGVSVGDVHLRIENVTLDVECSDATSSSYGLNLGGSGKDTLTIGTTALVQIKAGAADNSGAISYLNEATIAPPILVPANGKIENNALRDKDGNVAKEALIGRGLTPITIKAPEGVTYTTEHVLVGGYAKIGEVVHIETGLPTGYRSEFKLTGAQAGSGGDDPESKTASVGFLVREDPITVEISFLPYTYEIDFYNNDGTEENTHVETIYD